MKVVHWWLMMMMMMMTTMTANVHQHDDRKTKKCWVVVGFVRWNLVEIFSVCRSGFQLTNTIGSKSTAGVKYVTYTILCVSLL